MNNIRNDGYFSIKLNQPWQLRLGGYIFLLVAVGLLVTACFNMVKTMYTLSNGIHTQGEIVSVDSRYENLGADGREEKVYYITVVFENESGEEIRFKDRQKDLSLVKEKGDTVPVIYVSANPEEAIVDRGVMNWELSGALFFISLVFIIVGRVLICASKNPQMIRNTYIRNDPLTMVLIGFLCLVISIAFFVGVYFSSKTALELRKNGVITTGHVVEIVRHRITNQSNGHTGTSYSPVVAFQDQNGEKFRFDDNVSATVSPYNIGEEVEVLYDPTSPDTAIINRDPLLDLTGSFVFTGFGLFMGVMSIGAFMNARSLTKY